MQLKYCLNFMHLGGNQSIAEDGKLEGRVPSFKKYEASFSEG